MKNEPCEKLLDDFDLSNIFSSNPVLDLDAGASTAQASPILSVSV